MGDHTTCTPELTAAFVKLIEDGNYFDTACGVLGVSRSAAYAWLQKAEQGIPASGPDPEVYKRFADALTRAEAVAEHRAVEELRRAAGPQEFETTEKGMPFAVVFVDDDKGVPVARLPGDPRMAIEFLQRRFRDRWSKTEGREHSGEVGVKHSWWAGIEEAQAEDETQRRPDES